MQVNVIYQCNSAEIILCDNRKLSPTAFGGNTLQIEVCDIVKDICDYEKLFVLCNINHSSMGIQPEYDFPVHVRSN